MLDTSSLTSLVSALRAQTAKDSISPESLGAILQQMLDLMATATTSTDISELTRWLEGIASSKTALTAIRQGAEDTTQVVLDADTVTLRTGEKQTVAAAALLRPATLERAGVMTASQVSTLASAMSQIAALLTKAEDIIGKLSDEAALRDQADTALQANIDSEATARQAADASLQENIDSEAKARESGDTALEDSINTESSLRISADNTLKSSISNEVIERTNADNNLQKSIEEAKQGLSDYKSEATGLFLPQTALMPGSAGASVQTPAAISGGITYKGSTASGVSSAAFGNETTASGHASHSEGSRTKATNSASHAEGYSSNANGENAHAEGSFTTAGGDSTHAEGRYTEATAPRAHAEGAWTKANADNSHAEGYYTTVRAKNGHAEGRFNQANELSIHAEGIGLDAQSRKNSVDVYYNNSSSSDTHNGHRYIIGVGGYDGTNLQSTDESGKAILNPDILSVQEIISDLLTRVAALETKLS